MDEYPLENMGQVFVHGRIPSQSHGASIHTVDEYTLKIMEQVVVLWAKTLSRRRGKYSSVDEYHLLFNQCISRVFVKYVRIRAGCET